MSRSPRRADPEPWPRYDEPQRRYHDRRHLHAVLASLRRWLGPDLSPALEAAALWHDAVYDPTRSDNEALSADACAAHLQTLGTDRATIDRAVTLILSTRTHAPPDHDSDALALLDADLWILGAAPEVYARYADAIRAEYAHVPDDAFRTGRAAVLKHFLDRDRIYRGAWPGVRRREAAARRNLLAENARLAAGS